MSYKIVHTAAGPMLVCRYSMIGSRSHVVFSAYEPTMFSLEDPGHYSITHVAGRWWGRPGTEHCAEADAMPVGSPERVARLGAHRAAGTARARSAIVLAFPEAKDAPDDFIQGSIMLTSSAVWEEEDAAWRAEEPCPHHRDHGCPCTSLEPA